MLYTIYSGNTITHCNAKNASAAHKIASAKQAATAAKISVYPTVYYADNYGINAYAVLRGALQIAKTAAAKQCGGGGKATDYKRVSGDTTQWQIYNALCACNASAANTDDDKLYPTDDDKAAAVLSIIKRLDSTAAADYISAAYNGILDAVASGNTDMHRIYRNGYIRLNAYIMSLRTKRQREISTEYIKLNGGDLIAYNLYVARIIRGGEKYAAADSTSADSGGGVLTAADRVKLSAALTAAAALLTPRQREIMRLLAQGLSVRTIAGRIGVKSPGTISTHITLIRAIISDYIVTNAPQFSGIINSATAAAAATAAAKRNSDRHKR